MLVCTGVAFFFLSLLPSYAAGQLVSAEAKCAPGFEWLFTSRNQTPCDVAQELGGVCVAGRLNITQLAPGNVYFGPFVELATSCRCSSVYYSLLSACAYCQQRSYIRWSAYNGNCSTTYVATFPQPIPLGVRVPRWAYQDVSAMDIFDINIANNTDKSEGPPPSMTGRTSTSSPSSSGYTSGTTSDGKIGIIAASVGGLIGLAVIGGIIAFCLMRRRRRSSKTDTKLQPVLTDFNHPPEVTRPTIPGFSAPGTPYVPSSILHSTRPFHVPNSANTSPQGYAMSVGGTSEIYETSPVLFSNVDSRNTTSAIPATTNGYYDPQTSLSTVPVTTDNYWAQTSSPSIAHSHPTTDMYYESTLHTHQTGDSRYNDLRSAITHRQSIQSSVVSSSQTNPGTALTSTESRVNLLPPAYTDIVDGASRRTPLPEKQGL